MSADVPPLAGEDHVCAACGTGYAELGIVAARSSIAALPAAARQAVLSMPAADRARRPSADVWAVVEYVCHLRDVHVTSTIRLHRVRTEDRLVLEPMFNDLRARRFRYREHAVDAVLDELALVTLGLLEEVDRITDADRTATRLAGEERTARWLVRQAAHEGTHHVSDIQAVGAWLLSPGRG